MSLKNQVAVVTGGAKGIGAAVVRKLCSLGADVAVVDFDQSEEVSFSDVPGNGRLWHFHCDVTDSPSVEETVNSVLQTVGTVAILVNNAGGSGVEMAQTLDETSEAIWRHVMELNLTSTFRFCRLFAPAMREAGYGRIINISSAARHSVPKPFPTLKAHIPYVTAKAAIAAFTKQVAKELGPDGITCNAVAPGMILPGPDARITKQLMAQPAELREAVLASIPVRRFGTGEDIAELVAFLASQASGYVSGQTIDASGG